MIHSDLLCGLGISDGSDMETVTKNISNFLGYGKGNKEPLTELFVTLLLKVTPVAST